MILADALTFTVIVAMHEAHFIGIGVEAGQAALATLGEPNPTLGESSSTELDHVDVETRLIRSLQKVRQVRCRGMPVVAWSCGHVCEVSLTKRVGSSVRRLTTILLLSVAPRPLFIPCSTAVLFQSAKYQRKNGVFSKHYRVDSKEASLDPKRTLSRPFRRGSTAEAETEAEA